MHSKQSTPNEALVASVVVSWYSIYVVMFSIWAAFCRVLSSCDAGLRCLLSRFFSCPPCLFSFPFQLAPSVDSGFIGDG